MKKSNTPVNPSKEETSGPEMPVPKKKKFKWWYIPLAIVVIFILAKAFGGNGDNTSSNVSDSSGADTTAQETVASETKTALETTAHETTAPETQTTVPAEAPYEATLTSGNYTAGVDFPEGKYDIEAVSGSGNVSSSNMFEGGINAMMGDASAGDQFEQSYQNISLDNGVCLSVSGGVSIKISSDAASTVPLTPRNQSITESVTLSNGNFVAGDDFPAGVYDITATSGGGNVSSSNLYDGGLNAVMGTESDPMYEKEYKNVELPEGTTLTISGVDISLTPSK